MKGRTHNIAHKNEEVMTELKIEPFMNCLQHNKEKWKSRIGRMDMKMFVKAILYCSPRRRRKDRGGLRKTVCEMIGFVVPRSNTMGRLVCHVKREI
jgi:hypothetical protein